jgi:beta-phosphoglucomutase
MPRSHVRVAAIVLDMDGLMLDTEPIYKSAWQQAAGDLGYELDDPSYMNLVGRYTEDCERELLKKFGADFPIAKFRPRWSELWRLRVESTGIATKPGLLEFLSFVDGHNLPVGVATSSDREYTESSLRRAGLKGRFKVIVTGDQVAHGKPAPDIYLESARRLGVEPSRCVALEDSDAGILAASRAGMLPLLVPDLKAPSADAVTAAFRVLSSLHEAQRLVSTLIDD